MILFLLGCLFAKSGPTEAGPMGSCGDTAAEASFAVAPNGNTQIHAASAFDGQALWITWSEVRQNQFQVWATRVACDGTPLVPPLRLDDSDFDALDPAVAVHDGQVLVAWQQDDGGQPFNLDVLTVVLGLSGERVRGPSVFELDRPGAGNFWMPAVASTSNGFVLAGAAGIETNFRAVMVELDPMGDAAGPVLEPLPDGSISQTEPEIAASGTSLHLVFDGGGQGYRSVDGATATSLGSGSFPAVSAAGTTAMTVADGVDVDGVLVQANAGGVAVTDGFVGWYRPLEGFRNEIKVARIDGSERQDVGTVEAPPYGWNLTQIEPDLVFVAYQEGNNPDFQLRGRFLRF